MPCGPHSKILKSVCDVENAVLQCLGGGGGGGGGLPR